VRGVVNEVSAHYRTDLVDAISEEEATVEDRQRRLGLRND
jgi:hypothetical protein